LATRKKLKRKSAYAAGDAAGASTTLGQRGRRNDGRAVNSTTLAPERGRRSASQLRRVRSSSVDRSNTAMRDSARNPANGGFATLEPEDLKDFSRIGVYSREAFENFGKKWRAQNYLAPNDNRATKKSKLGADPSEVEDRLGRLSSSEVTSGIDGQINALFEDRMIPHVIAVIEGKEEQTKLSINATVQDEAVELGYTKVIFSQGLTSTGSNDAKQNISIYVRNDMTAAYRASEINVPHGSDKIPCIGIDYSTADGTNYRSLVVHIPNKFVGSDKKDAATYKAFEDYAQGEANRWAGGARPPVVVTGFLGDTNFKKQYGDNTSPSMGGHLSSGETLNPQSSGAKNETHFMQSVPLKGADDGHVVLQPATLNYVFLPTDAQNREATDHPSIMSFTAHNSEIVGRDPKMIPAYYQ
jgi:hypothetical protein